MKLNIILLILSLCATTLKAQNDYEYRYWFDHDESKGVVTGTSSTPQWDMTIDVSQATPEMHTLHIQVADTAGSWGPPVTRYFMKMPLQGDYTLHYQIDEGASVTMPFSGVASFDLDVSSLTDGMHKLTCSVMTSEGDNTATINRLFFKSSRIDSLNPVKCYIEIDERPYSTLKLPAKGGVIDLDIDTDSLSVGLHNISIKALMPDGVVSTIHKKMFYRRYTTQEANATSCYYAIDGVIDSSGIHKLEDGVLLLDIDATKLSPGMHTLELNVANRYGYVNYSHKSIFYRMPTHEEFYSLKCHYYIDDETDNIQVCDMVDGIADMQIDVSRLIDGMHKITLMLIGNKETHATPQVAYFIKQSGIRMYEYWLNEEYDKRTTEVLNEPQTPFSIISLLPVEAVPVRSKLFHFEETDGVPTIYAKNIFNILFFYGKQVVSERKSYIDYNVSEAIDANSIVDITSRTSHTTTTPADNKIKWYKFYSEEGDSIAIHTDKACSLNIFDSEGNQLYSASGIESTQPNGTHTLHNGTYYIALHDVTQNGSDITLHYMHLDKYAYISHTPENAGVESGKIYINLYGNGFNYIKSIKLSNNNHTLYSDTITASDNNHAIARCAVSGYNNEYGLYDMTMYFEDNNTTDSLLIKDAITIEKAIYGDIIINVSSSTQYSNPHPVTVKVKNTGNVPYCYIPLNIAYEGDKRVKFEDFVISVSAEFYECGGKIATVTDNLLNRGVRGTFIPLLIPLLQPYEEIEFTLNFMETVANRPFKFYAWAGTPWSIEYKTLMNEEDVRRNASANYDYRSNISSLNNVRSMSGLALNNANVYTKLGRMIGNIMLGLGANNQKAAWEASGMEYEDWYEQVGQYLPQYGQRMENPGDIMRGDLYDFLDYPQPGDYDDYNDGLDDQAENDNPMPDPNNIRSDRSFDPNDIIGYTAPSGSKYIGIDRKKISYTIEFENDSLLATAPARQVVLRDTLDSRIFDLTTIAPRNLTIGSKRIELDGKAPFVKTIDMRPEINTVVLLEMNIEAETGATEWVFSSLDPMTMELTELIENGFLPINDANGRGQGSVTFDIALRDGLSDGTVIETDYVRPVAWVSNMSVVNDSTIDIYIDGIDARSGLWKYDLYVQKGNQSDWTAVACDITESIYHYNVDKDIEYSFCIIATDMAGNREDENFIPEYYYNNGLIFSDVTEISKENVYSDEENYLYDLRGIRVENPTPGIYIRKGKKVVIYR